MQEFKVVEGAGEETAGKGINVLKEGRCYLQENCVRLVLRFIPHKELFYLLLYFDFPIIL